METISSTSSEKLNRFQASLSGLQEHTIEIDTDSTDVVYSVFVVLTKLDHLLFKSRGYKTVFLNCVDDEFTDHHGCRLGTWYDTGLGKEVFGSMQSYPKLEAPHKIVHDRIHDAIACVKSGSCGEKAKNVKNDQLNRYFRQTAICFNKLKEIILPLLPV